MHFKSGLADRLIDMVYDQSFFDDLSAYGCNANSWSGSYTDKSLTITLK